MAAREAFLTGVLPPAAARLTVGTHPLGAPVAAALFPPGQAVGVAVGAAAPDAAAAPAVHVWLRDDARPLDVVRGLWTARLVVAALPPGADAADAAATAAAGNGAAAAAAAGGSSAADASTAAAAAALSAAAATAEATWPALLAGLEAGGWDTERLLFATAGPGRYEE